MKRVWYQDGTYMDMAEDCVWENENDPDWVCTELIDGGTTNVPSQPVVPDLT